MRRNLTLLAAVLVLASRVHAQTTTLVGGVVADSSVAGPVATMTQLRADGGSTSVGISGWTLHAERRNRIAPRTHLAASVSLTPLHAHSSNRVFANGERRRELEFDDAAVELTFGRIDNPLERWHSDVRVVAMYERVDGVGSETARRWSRPHAGVRVRQSYRRIVAEDPLLMTFEGLEVRGDGDLMFGRDLWGRARIEQRWSTRRGRWMFGESAVAFQGHELDIVNAFLVGGSWPVGDQRPLYGFRNAELRLERGAGVNADLQAFFGRTLVSAHGGFLQSDGTTHRGVAFDVARSFSGVGVRLGVGRQIGGNDSVVIYGSVLAAYFWR